MAKQKKVNPLNVKFNKGGQPQMRDEWSDEFKEFWADSLKYYTEGKLPDVKQDQTFCRFILAAAEEHFPNEQVPKVDALVRYLRDDLQKA